MASPQRAEAIRRSTTRLTRSNCLLDFPDEMRTEVAV
jgi:hypothetical protein